MLPHRLKHGSTVALSWNFTHAAPNRGNGPCLAAQIVALDTRVVPSRGYGVLPSNSIFISLTWSPFSALNRWYGNSFILEILPALGNLLQYCTTVCISKLAHYDLSSRHLALLPTLYMYSTDRSMRRRSSHRPPHPGSWGAQPKAKGYMGSCVFGRDHTRANTARILH
jgi:hypothetical protein